MTFSMNSSLFPKFVEKNTNLGEHEAPISMTQQNYHSVAN